MVAGSKKCVFVALVMDCARPGARRLTGENNQPQYHCDTCQGKGTLTLRAHASHWYWG